jgi:hypothetical protein
VRKVFDRLGNGTAASITAHFEEDAHDSSFAAMAHVGGITHFIAAVNQRDCTADAGPVAVGIMRQALRCRTNEASTDPAGVVAAHNAARGLPEPAAHSHSHST